jgi:hypothetical protein
VISDGNSARGVSGLSGDYGQNEESSDPKPHGCRPLHIDFVFDLWFQMVTRPRQARD